MSYFLRSGQQESSFSQRVPAMERLSKTYMTLSHISLWYLWLCQTFSVKFLLGSVSHVAGAPLISTFFLWIWHVSAQYTAPELCLVINFALSQINVSIFLEINTEKVIDCNPSRTCIPPWIWVSRKDCSRPLPPQIKLFQTWPDGPQPPAIRTLSFCRKLTSSPRPGNPTDTDIFKIFAHVHPFDLILRC